MPRLTALASICLLAVTGTVSATTGKAIDPTVMDRAYGQLGKAFVDAGKSDGLSIAVVDHGNVRFYNFGTVSRMKASAPTEHTVYEIGSITKVFTSLLLAQAIVQGRARADDDLRRYLPGPYPNLVYKDTPIHLIDLADTTSSLPDNLPDYRKLAEGAPPDRLPFIAAKAFNDYNRTRLFADLNTAQISSQPGTAPKHSNVASILLAVVVEKALGANFAQLLDTYIEKAFRMRSGLGNARDADVAVGYDAEHRVMPSMNTPYIATAAGLRYSAQDMSRFILGELDSSNPAIALSQRVAWGDPEGDALAYNWKLDKTIGNERRLRASGGTFGFSSYIELYPESGYGVVLLSNRSSPATQVELQTIADQARVEMLGKPAAQTALESALTKADFANFAAVVATVQHGHPELHLAESSINTWAYSLLRAKKPAQAIGMFQYNVDHWPKSWNAWDSLGEAYEVSGDKAKAIENYRRSLALNPDNAHATEKLKALSAAAEQDSVFGSAVK